MTRLKRTSSATCLFITLACMPPGVSSAKAEVPDFFTTPKVNAAQFAVAVNHFVELGEEEAVEALLGIRSKQTFSGKIDVHFRLACVCRVLWQNRDQPIPPPHMGMYGGGVSMGAGQSANLKDWPLFPVAKSGGSYFIMVYGGRGGTGTSHRLPISHLTRCQTLGSFLSEKLAVPASKKAEIDAIQLRQSARWIKEFPSKDSDREAWTSIDSQIPAEAKTPR